MARKINFRSKVAESLKENDAIAFQTLIKQKLIEKFNNKAIDTICESLSTFDNEGSMVTAISTASKTYGGFNPVYEMGLLNISFSNKDAPEHFAEQLDKLDYVEYYEITPKSSYIEEGGATDLEYDGFTESYDMNIFFDLDSVSLPANIDQFLESLDEEKKKCKEEDEMDDEESEDEMDDEKEDMNEVLNIANVFNKESIQELLKIKTAHWNAGLKRVTRDTETVCPPGKTGPDCSRVLTAQEKEALRIRLSKHMRTLSSGKKKKMISHAQATRAFVAQNNLTSKYSAKQKLGRI
jgi:hypothetical protein